MKSTLHAPTRSFLCSACSPAQQRLIRLITAIHYGRIHRLQVAGGLPVFEPAPLVLRTVKLAGHAERLPGRVDPDAPLAPELARLLKTLHAFGTGTVERIEIARGLPLLVDLVGSAL